MGTVYYYRLCKVVIKNGNTRELSNHNQSRGVSRRYIKALRIVLSVAKASYRPYNIKSEHDLENCGIAKMRLLLSQAPINTVWRDHLYELPLRFISAGTRTLEVYRGSELIVRPIR